MAPLDAQNYWIPPIATAEGDSLFFVLKLKNVILWQVYFKSVPESDGVSHTVVHQMLKTCLWAGRAFASLQPLSMCGYSHSFSKFWCHTPTSWQCFQVMEALRALHIYAPTTAQGEKLNFSWLHIQHPSQNFFLDLGERSTMLSSKNVQICFSHSSGPVFHFCFVKDWKWYVLHFPGAPPTYW